MNLSWSQQTVELKVPFRLSRWSYETRTQVMVRFKHGEWVGYGEASPNARYDQSPESCEAALAQIADRMQGDPLAYRLFTSDAMDGVVGEPAAKSAFVMAVLDWVGKATGLPLYRLLGLSKMGAPTTFSIGIDTPEKVAEAAKAAAAYHHVLKLKVDSDVARDIIAAVRNVVMTPLIVDGNETWTSPEKCLEDVLWMREHGVVVLEQPMPAAMLDEMAWLKSRSLTRLIADEAFTNADDLARLQQSYHGVNIKLAKCGGVLAALEAAIAARRMGMEVMLGCMVESGVAIAAAAHLASLAAFVDLDGNLLLKDDPCHALPLVNGVVALREAPGLGVWPG